VDVKTSRSPNGIISGIQPTKSELDFTMKTGNEQPTSSIFHGEASLVHFILLDFTSGKMVNRASRVDLTVRVFT
jgi:hypothetical protein